MNKRITVIEGALIGALIAAAAVGGVMFGLHQPMCAAADPVLIDDNTVLAEAYTPLVCDNQGNNCRISEKKP